MNIYFSFLQHCSGWEGQEKKHRQSSKGKFIYIRQNKVLIDNPSNSNESKHGMKKQRSFLLKLDFICTTQKFLIDKHQIELSNSWGVNPC